MGHLKKDWKKAHRLETEMVHFEFSREGSAEGQMPGLYVELREETQATAYHLIKKTCHMLDAN